MGSDPHRHSTPRPDIRSKLASAAVWIAGGTAVVLILIAVAAGWYAVVEDSRIGNDYARIIANHPELIPQYLGQIAALHIQVAISVGQSCFGLIIAVATIIYTRSAVRAARTDTARTEALDEISRQLSVIASALLPAHQQSP